MTWIQSPCGEKVLSTELQKFCLAVDRPGFLGLQLSEILASTASGEAYCFSPGTFVSLVVQTMLIFA